MVDGSPRSRERCSAPRPPKAFSPLPRYITWGSSALTSTPRQYGMDTWLLTCTGSQVAPLSVLEKISRGVMVNNVFGGPTVMARLWMSGSVTPLVTTSHVFPPSLLCRTPSTSRPAQMCWWSTGSTTRAVTLGMPTLGHSSYLYRQLVPMLTAIRGAEQRCRSGARKDNVGVDRINGEGPDGDLIHGRVQPLSMLAAVLAAVHAAVRATVHDTSVTGMHRQGAHGAFAMKAVADPQPGVSTIAAAPDALSKGAYTDRGICVMVSLLLLRRFPRNPQGLSHRLANRHKGVLLRGGGAEHPVVGHGDRQPGIGIRPPDRSPRPGMAKGPRVPPRRDHRQGWGNIANARHEMEATDATVVGHALHVVIITRRTRHAEPAHPLLRQEAHPIQLPTLGEHGEEPRGAARVHDAAGTRQTGPPHVSPSKHLLGRPHLRRDRQGAERPRGHPRRARRDRRHIGKGSHPRFDRIRDAHPEAVEVQWLTDFLLDEGAKLPCCADRCAALLRR